MLEKIAKVQTKALIVVLTVLLLSLIPLIVAYLNPGSDMNSFQDIVSKCSPSQSLDSASSCAVKVTSEFYSYNLSNAGRSLDFQQLKSQGGVCSSWAWYYDQVGQGLGYDAKSVIVHVGEDDYHEFSVWSNSQGYCIIDQTESKCFEFNN